MSTRIPSDFQEWMDTELGSSERNRIDVLLASQHVRMFLIGLFDHGATWDVIAQGAMQTRPSAQSPVEQTVTISLSLLNNDADELGQTLSDMKENGYAPFVKEVLQKLTIDQRNKLVDYVSL